MRRNPSDTRETIVDMSARVTVERLADVPT